MGTGGVTWKRHAFFPQTCPWIPSTAPNAVVNNGRTEAANGQEPSHHFQISVSCYFPRLSPHLPLAFPGSPLYIRCDDLAPFKISSQEEILEWVAISFSRGSFWPRDWTQVSCISGRFFTDWAIGKLLRKGAGIPISYSRNPSKVFSRIKKKNCLRASLVTQRIYLPMQETWVPSLIQKDPICCEATRPTHHNSWACAPELGSHSYWSACVLEPVVNSKRSHRNEKPAHHN